MEHGKAELVLGDTSHIKPHWASPSLIQKLHERVGLKLPEDQKAHFYKRLLEEAARNRNVAMALDVCVHCGACLDACHTYQTTRDIYNSPVGRAELVRRLVKSSRVSGKLLGRLVGAERPTDEYIERIATYYYQCNECRRCGEVCPFGIDQADLTRTVRMVLYESGIAAKYIATVIDNVERTGNNLGLPPKAIAKTLEFAKDSIREEKGIDVKVKLDEPAYALLLPPSADLFTNIDTLKGYILFLNLVGVDFTFSTKMIELANFGLFMDERHMKYIGDMVVKTAAELGVKVVIAGECGHGWRAFKNYTAVELEKRGIATLHIFHLVVEAIRSGAVKLDPERNGDVVYTFQDSCNYARGGDLTEEPRFIMRHVVKNFVESPNNRERTWCCGGGGGLLTDELLKLRIEYARKWYEDVVAVGAGHVVRACAICKAQLSHTIPHLNKEYNRQVTYSGLMDLVYRALVP